MGEFLMNYYVLLSMNKHRMLTTIHFGVILILKIQSFVEAFIDDVNHEDGQFLQYCENMTNSLFLIIKWAGIPFVIFLLLEFFKLLAYT